jgi:glycosyltransferase involved in cell wall biosynthesis
MLAGKPIVFNGKTEQNPVAEADCGLVLEQNSPREIAEAIALLADMDGESLAQMGQRGREYVLANRDYGTLALQYLRLFEKLTQNPAPKKP